MYSSIVTNCATLIQDVNNRGNCVAEEEYVGTLYFPIDFSVNLKLL